MKKNIPPQQQQQTMDRADTILLKEDESHHAQLTINKTALELFSLA